MHAKSKYLHAHDPFGTINTKDTAAPFLKEQLKSLSVSSKMHLKPLITFLFCYIACKLNNSRYDRLMEAKLR